MEQSLDNSPSYEQLASDCCSMATTIESIRKLIIGTQPTAVQQLKAEIAEVVRYLEDNHPSSEFGPNHIISHVLGTLRQLSAV